MIERALQDGPIAIPINIAQSPGGSKALEEMQDELEGMKKHDDALKIFEIHGIRAYSQALALLGYKVKWSGLDPDNTEILKA